MKHYLHEPSDFFEDDPKEALRGYAGMAETSWGQG